MQPRQKALRALLERIPYEGSVLGAELAGSNSGAYKKLKDLEKLGLVEKLMVARTVTPVSDYKDETRELLPTPSQAEAIGAIRAARTEQTFITLLLQGVTGSGKTEVYLRVIE